MRRQEICSTVPVKKLTLTVSTIQQLFNSSFFYNFEVIMNQNPTPLLFHPFRPIFHKDTFPLSVSHLIKSPSPNQTDIKIKFMHFCLPFIAFSVS